MEGKKVLWVVFSIALALVVILAGGLFLLRPRQPKSAETPARTTPSLQGYDPYEYVRGTSEPPGLTLPPTEPQPMVIVVGEQPAPPERAIAPPERAIAPQERAIAPQERAIAPQERATAPQERAIAQPPASQPLPAAAAGPAAAARSGGKAGEPQAVAQVVPPAASPAPSQAASKPAAKAVAKPAGKPASKPERVTEYWIQAGSFSSAARAEEVARRLEERGLAARTSTRDLNGKTHFRVRVGPYASKAEAEKFLGWIRELKGFETSYISMVAGRRAMP
jgi:cell division protein FtsN